MRASSLIPAAARSATRPSSIPAAVPSTGRRSPLDLDGRAAPAPAGRLLPLVLLLAAACEGWTPPDPAAPPSGPEAPPASGPEAVATAAQALHEGAPAADVVISQVYGGGGNAGAPFSNDFVELFNRSAAPVSLDGWSVQYTSASGTGNFGQIALLGGVLAPGRSYLVQMAAGTTPSAPLPTPDATGPANMSASAGKVALVGRATALPCNGGSTPCAATDEAAILDLVGYGAANYFETAPAPALSNTTAALRAAGGCRDGNDNATDFTAAAPAPRNGASAAQPCGGPVEDAAPAVAGTSPAAGSAGVGPAAPVEITFSEAVEAAPGAFQVACTPGGPVAVTVSGGATSFTLEHAAPFPAGATCTVTVAAAAIRDQDATDPPDSLAADYTFDFGVASGPGTLRIRDLQGRAHRSPRAGQVVSAVPGVVTVVRDNGFFFQDPAPDADEATSEGLFVFTAGPPAVRAGDQVLVSGLVKEFRAGCDPSCGTASSAFDNLTTTEIERPSSVAILSRDNPLPPPVAVGPGPGERRAPGAVIDDDSRGDVEVNSAAFDPARDGIDFYESLEGMRVVLADPVAVGPTTEFASPPSRELPVLARNGGGAGVRSPRGGIVLSPGDFNPERLFLSSPPSVLPMVDVGARFPGQVVGVLDYNFGNFKLLVESAPAPLTPRLHRETLSFPAPRSSELTMATLNVENLDAGDPDSKFAALAEIVVRNLGAPDLVALEEVQDNNGPTNDAVVDASATLGKLAAAISAAGGPAYQFRGVDPADDQDGGEPGGNIRVVFMFRGDRGLEFVDRPGATATTANRVRAVGGAPQLELSPGRLEPGNAAFLNSRKPLAAELSFNGRPLFVVANHFNSKGGDDPLFGRFQPPVLGSEAQRLAQAEVVARFVRDVLAIDRQARVLVMGDLNDFQFSPPLEALKAAGLNALVERLPPGERYSYVFQGNSQALDHILVSRALLLASYDIVHVNAEFADQASDHDPTAVRFNVPAPARVVTPLLECVARTPSGGYLAHFGYQNDDPEPISIPVGLRNLFVPLPAQRGQPDSFAPGRHPRLFSVPFRKGSLLWSLAGRTVVATTSPLQRCP